MKDDAFHLANAFYCNNACEVAEAHHLDYFDLKTEHGKSGVQSEVNAKLAGRGAMELALFVIPFSEVEIGSEAAKAAQAVAIEGKVAEAGSLAPEAAEFAKAGALFPKMVKKMAETLERLRNAMKTSRFTARTARLGNAASMDYRATFLAANKEIEPSNVVVHHAIEQQALTRYPGVIAEAEMHSLENLRGIPKALDAVLHKTEIAKEWNDFYRLHPAATVTKELLLQKATEIDCKFGHLFTPKLL